VGKGVLVGLYDSVSCDPYITIAECKIVTVYN
jgi:hypothetical protein